MQHKFTEQPLKNWDQRLSTEKPSKVCENTSYKKGLWGEDQVVEYFLARDFEFVQSRKKLFGVEIDLVFKKEITENTSYENTSYEKIRYKKVSNEKISDQKINDEKQKIKQDYIFYFVEVKCLGEHSSLEGRWPRRQKQRFLRVAAVLAESKTMECRFIFAVVHADKSVEIFNIEEFL